MSSIWNALTGQKSSSSQQSNAPTPEPTTTFSSPPFDPSSAQGVDSFFNNSAFADPSTLHPLAGLDKDALDYITLEDSALSDLPGGQSVLPSRGWSDDLCYGTGITYLSALTLGGAWGMQEGLRRSAGQAPKLRLNSTLNAITRRGPYLGNSAGVVAIVYNVLNSSIGYFRGKHDTMNSVLAGFLSGVMFKSTRGLKPMAISGGIVGGVALAWQVSYSLSSPTYSEHEAYVLIVHKKDLLPGASTGARARASLSDYNPRRRRPDANYDISGRPAQAQLLRRIWDGCSSHGASVQTKNISDLDMHLSQAWWAEAVVHSQGDNNLFEYLWELIRIPLARG